MDNRNEILFAVREARRNLGDAADFRVADALAILEGIAPFLNKRSCHRDEVQELRQLCIGHIPFEPGFLGGR